MKSNLPISSAVIRLFENESPGRLPKLLFAYMSSQKQAIPIYTDRNRLIFTYHWYLCKNWPNDNFINRGILLRIRLHEHDYYETSVFFDCLYGGGSVTRRNACEEVVIIV